MAILPGIDTLASVLSTAVPTAQQDQTGLTAQQKAALFALWMAAVQRHAGNIERQVNSELAAVHVAPLAAGTLIDRYTQALRHILDPTVPQTSNPVVTQPTAEATPPTLAAIANRAAQVAVAEPQLAVIAAVKTHTEAHGMGMRRTAQPGACGACATAAGDYEAPIPEEAWYAHPSCRCVYTPLPAGNAATEEKSMAEPTKTVGGKALPKTAFAYTPSDNPSTWKLRIDDAQHVGGAIAALGKGFRGKTVAIPTGVRAGVLARVRAAWHTFHPDETDQPDLLTAAQTRMAEPEEPDDENGNPVWDPDNDGDNDAVPSQDTDHDAGTAMPRRAGDQPGSSDLHIDSTGGGSSKTPPPHFLKKLVAAMRDRMGQQGYVKHEEFAGMVRSARGYAGGKGKAARTAADPPADVLGSYPMPCPSCVGGNASDCECPGCIADDVCWCQGVMTANAGAPPMEPLQYGSPLRSGTQATFSLFMPLRSFAEAPEWIPYLPKPGTFQHPKYGEISITRERNADFVYKFSQGVYQKQLPLDAEHETKLSGAMGWISALRMNGDGSVDARVDWTDRGRTMLSDNRFKYISPEWYDEWTDPATNQAIANVAIGGALTTRPYFKEASLRPLVANEQGIQVPDEDTHPVPRLGAGTTAPGGRGGTMTTATVQLTEEQFNVLTEQAKRATEVEAQSKQAIEQAQADAKRANERVAAVEKESRLKSFAEEARQWTGDLTGHVSFMEGLSEEQRTFYRTQQTAHAAQLKEAGLFREIGAPGTLPGGNDPQRQLTELTRAYAAEHKVSMAEAGRRVMAERPDLAAEAKQASTIRV